MFPTFGEDRFKNNISKTYMQDIYGTYSNHLANNTNYNTIQL